jgi:hypothetical protein
MKELLDQDVQQYYVVTILSSFPIQFLFVLEMQRLDGGKGPSPQILCAKIL